MKIVGLFVSAALALAWSVPVIASSADVASAPDAQAPVQLKMGEIIRTSDGRQIGRVDHVVFDRAGKAMSAKLIYDGRFLTVPVASLVRADKGVTTTLTLAAIRSGK
jgi:sporulation protein YlmC with PRC-barrel domain